MILVEPLRVYSPHIDKWLSTRPGEAHYAAVGEQEGYIYMNYREDCPEQSSMLERSNLTRTASERIIRIRVPLLPLDKIISAEALKGQRVLLKIDAQGNELSALRGASRTLAAAHFVIIHTSVAPRFEKNYEPWQTDELIKNAGFRLKSIINAGIDVNHLCRVADMLYEKAE